MADEVVMNGGDRTLDISEKEDPEVSELLEKIVALEHEKSDLVTENEAVRERITKLEGEIEVLKSEKTELRRELETLDVDNKSLEEYAAKARNEVTELRREIETSDVDYKSLEEYAAKARNEVIELERELAKLKKRVIEMKEKYELLKNEKDGILKRLGEAEEDLRDEVGEVRVEELTKKLEDLEVRERDLKAEIVEKDNEIWELNFVVARNDEEKEKLKKERDELEGVKSWLEGLLEKSEKRVNEMEEKIGQLGKELEVSELVISGLKEKTLDGINGINLVEDGEKGIYGPKLHWPVLAVSTGLVVTIGALWYLRAKQR